MLASLPSPASPSSLSLLLLLLLLDSGSSSSENVTRALRWRRRGPAERPSQPRISWTYASKGGCGEMGECYPSGIRIQRASSHTYLDCVSTRLMGGTHHHLPVETGDGVWQAREVEGDRAPVAQHNDVVARARGVITAGAVVLWAPEALLVAGPVHEGHGFQASTHKEATAVHTEHGGGVISNWIEKHGSVEEQHATELPHMESGACWDVSGHPLGVVEAAAALHAALAHTGVVRLHARLQVVPALATVQAGVSVGVAVGAQPLVIRGHAGQLQAVQVESSGTRSWDVCTTEGVENKRHRD